MAVILPVLALVLYRPTLYFLYRRSFLAHIRCSLTVKQEAEAHAFGEPQAGLTMSAKAIQPEKLKKL